MREIQRDLVDSAFIKFIELYQAEHPNFSYKHERAVGKYANGYNLIIKYTNANIPVEVEHRINMYYDLPFFLGKRDPSQVAIERGLERLVRGLHQFECQVKQDLQRAHSYNVDDIVANAYAEFKNDSVRR